MKYRIDYDLMSCILSDFSAYYENHSDVCRKIPYATWKTLAEKKYSPFFIEYKFDDEADFEKVPATIIHFSGENKSKSCIFTYEKDNPKVKNFASWLYHCVNLLVAESFDGEKYILSYNLKYSKETDMPANYNNYKTTYDIENKINKDTTDKKENKSTMFNFDFGPVNSDKIRISMYGLAIQNTSGTFVSFDSKNHKIIDVEIMNIPNSGKYIIKMPVAIKDLAAGDVIEHQGRPVIICDVSENGRISAIDPFVSEEKTILPITNMFGFDYVTKYISLFNGLMGTPSADEPFGNMMPFMLMSNGDGDMSNAMLMMAMMNDSNNKDMIPFLLMNQNGNSNNNALMAYYLMNHNK